MRSFLSNIIMPLPVFYMLLLAGAVLHLMKRKRISRTFFYVAASWFLIISTPPVPRLLVKSLENRYPHLTEEVILSLPDSCDIIVLGGGHSDDISLSANNQLSTTAIGRLTEGIRINRMLPGSRLVLSGFRGSSDISQAMVLYRAGLLLGVDSASMAIQEKPGNTMEEAEEYAGNYGKLRKLIVVTDDIHMPRAMMNFRRAGLDPVASPTNQVLKYGSRKNRISWFPSAANIGIMEAVIHEYAGILWTVAGGR
jgi:uncharacterized SAM-binding protein YcdF (DUF218 family)